MLNIEIEADKFVVSENYWLEILTIDLGSSEFPGPPKLIQRNRLANTLKNSPILRAGIRNYFYLFSWFLIFCAIFLVLLYKFSLMNNGVDFFVTCI